MRDLALVLVAAGQGERLGAGVPKALATLANQTLLSHAVRNALKVDGLTELVVTAPEAHIEEFAEIVIGVANQADTFADIKFVVGGVTRQDSISNGLDAIDAEDGVVLVHDVARSLTPASLFERVALAVQASGSGVVPIQPVVDTIKRIVGEQVSETVDRTTLGAAQTPQGFPLQLLRAAYANPAADFTDDAALFQSTGATVIHVPGEALAFKITTPDDLIRAEGLFQTEYRSGIGTDTHRFTDDTNKPLYLGTVEWAGETGLDGHSDGDALSHAIVDALLSAAGLGDIGTNFGVDRPEFAGSNGEVFILETMRLLAEAGWKIENVSTQLIGNRPKVAPHRERVESVLSALVGAPVTLGATTTDGLGFLGQTEGVAAVATALISRKGWLK
ncbi:MAG: hypothetical protein RL719_838 [Actinomycetota bacterium]